jgi:hypothetical protein
MKPAASHGNGKIMESEMFKKGYRRHGKQIMVEQREKNTYSIIVISDGTAYNISKRYLK